MLQCTIGSDFVESTDFVLFFYITLVLDDAIPAI